MAQRLPSRLLLVPDARSAESALLAEVERAQQDDPLARVVVVVPSHPLRTRVLALLVEGDRARLGVQVLTLRALASSILARVEGVSGDVEAGEALFDLFVARLAARERALSTLLAPLEGGYAGVSASVSDLLDAGFRAELAEEAAELLQSEGAAIGGGAVDRGLAILRIAARLPRELAERGAMLEGARTVAATEAILEDPESALPASRVIVHGVSDATGLASDLLQTIFGRLPTTFLLPVPPPIEDRDFSGWRFGSRLRERLEGLASPESIAATENAARLPFRGLPDLARETQDALEGKVAAVARGVRPERLAIVARDLVPYRSALERGIDRQAVPASGSAGGEHRAAGVARAWIALLERGAESPLDLLSAVVGADALGRDPGRTASLRRDAAKTGLRRLGEIAEHAQSSALAPLAAPIQRILRDLLPLGRPIELREAHLRIGKLLTAGRLHPEIDERLRTPLSVFARRGIGELRVEPVELRALLAQLWSRAGERPLGGDGAGVALLSVTEARSLSFDRLHLVGLSRDRFPRRVRTDPFLPDSLRARLRTLLPDLPVKVEGHDEERFLFAQLLVAAPEVVLTAPARDEGGRELARSSLVDELARAGRLLEAAVPTPSENAPRAAIERVVEDALALRALERPFAMAAIEGRERFGDTALSEEQTAGLARQSIRVLREYSADPRDARRLERLGPFFGLTGDPAPGPRTSGVPHITSLESLARCGWQTFLQKWLQLRPPPAVEDEIPSLPSRLAGTVLHRFLDALAPAEIHGGSLASALAREPVPVAWPESVAELERRLEVAAVDTLRDEGIDAALFVPPLLRAARALAEVARATDWAGDRQAVLAVESEGEAEVPVGGGVRRVRFRVDRVNRSGSAGAHGGSSIVLTDYKTGKALSTKKKPESRAGDLARAIAEGSKLQLVAYAMAELPGGSRASGRLLFLEPGLEDAHREVLVTWDDAVLLRAPWSTLFQARERGALLPRLTGPDLRSTYAGCETCEVRVACVQGDSGARLRFERWAARREPDPTLLERAARELFELLPSRRGVGAEPGEPAAAEHDPGGES